MPFIQPIYSSAQLTWSWSNQNKYSFYTIGKLIRSSSDNLRQWPSTLLIAIVQHQSKFKVARNVNSAYMHCCVTWHGHGRRKTERQKFPPPFQIIFQFAYQLKFFGFDFDPTKNQLIVTQSKISICLCSLNVLTICIDTILKNLTLVQVTLTGSESDSSSYALHLVYATGYVYLGITLYCFTLFRRKILVCFFNQFLDFNSTVSCKSSHQ